MTPTQKEILEALETAFDTLTQARKLAVFAQDPVSKQIGVCLDQVENAFGVLHNKPLPHPPPSAKKGGFIPKPIKRDLGQEIESVLREHPEGLRIEDIALRTHRSQSCIYRCLTGRANQAMNPNIQKIRAAIWALVEPPQGS